MNETDWRDHAARLASFLMGEGLDTAWAETFASVPRHEFVADGRTFDVDSTAAETPGWNRAEFLRMAYADQVVVTRWETVNGERIATSSASQPAIVAIMLRLLDVDSDSRVLEIGTGPGYNACLLCTRLGDVHVTSVDIQDDVAVEASERLARLGFHPHIEVADGSLGSPSRAPFDRIIATCGLSRIPEVWLEQLAPGARVVAPMNFGGALAVLDRRDDGNLSGRFPVEAGFFMELRRPDESRYMAAPLGPERTMKTNASLDELGDLNFRLWLELSLSGAHMLPTRGGDGHIAKLRISMPDSTIEMEAGDEVRVIERGSPRWSMIEERFYDWHSHGRPGRTRMGMTVTPNQQWVWLDEEDSAVTWQI